MSVPFAYALQRDVIVATGKDTRSFLHSQLSNDIAGLDVGTTTYAFALEPTGKIAALLRVHCVADDHFVLDTDAGHAASAVARLSKFKIRVHCEFVATTQTVAALRGLTAELRSELLTKPGVVPAWRASDGAVDAFDNTDAIDAMLRAGSDDDYHAERVRCAWPLFGVDIDVTSLPAETGLADVAVSFTKGCYPGQELVERMDSRGSTAPHLLMRLPRVANPLVSTLTNTSAVPGEKYLASGTELGVCTSVAGDFALVQVRRACLAQAEQLKFT